MSTESTEATATPERRAPHPKVLLRRILVGVIAFCILVYTADFFAYTLRAVYPKLGAADSSVHRYRMLAIPTKNGKFDLEMDATKPEEDVPCARALFAHGNNYPCWYVKRHANDPIMM
jgi:hypothetical protein